MTEEEMKKIKQTVDYFKYWYDEVGEERIAILEKAVNELEASTEMQEELSEAKEIIDRFLDFEASAMERGIYIADDLREKAEAFLKE